MNAFFIFIKKNIFFIVCFFCLFFLFVNSIIQLRFFLDDFVLVFPVVLKAFSTHFMQYTYDYGLFRPLALLYYYAIYSIYLFSPVLAHFVPFTLHFSTGVFLFLILKKQKVASSYALVLSLLYIVSPLATEAYMWFAANPGTISAFFLLLQILIIMYESKKTNVIVSVLFLQLVSVFFYESGLFFFIPLSFLISKKFGEKNKLAERKLFLTTGLILLIPEVVYAITKLLFKVHVVTRTLVMNYGDIIHNFSTFVSNIVHLFFDGTFFTNFWVQNTLIGIEIIKSHPLTAVFFLGFILSIAVYFIQHYRQNDEHHSYNFIFWLLLLLTSLFPLFFLKNTNFPFRILFLPFIFFIITISVIVSRLQGIIKLSGVLVLLLLIILYSVIDLGIAERYKRQFIIDEQISNTIKQTLAEIGFTDTYPANVLLEKNFQSDVYSKFGFSAASGGEYSVLQAFTSSNVGFGEHIISCYSNYWCAQAELNMITARVKQIEIQFENKSVSGPVELPYETFIKQRPFVKLEQVGVNKMHVIEVNQ